VKILMGFGLSLLLSFPVYSSGNYGDGDGKRGKGGKGDMRGRYQDGPRGEGQKGGRRGGKRGGRHRGQKDILRFCKHSREKCEIKSTKISNGVRIELTSRDERTRKLLQALGARMVLDQEIKGLMGKEP
jgi:hypothetical protein